MFSLSIKRRALSVKRGAAHFFAVFANCNPGSYMILYRSAKGGQDMVIHGLQKLTLLDYPGHTACTVFTAHCPWRCPFCHNASLVLEPESQPVIPEEEIFSFPGSHAAISAKSSAECRPRTTVVRNSKSVSPAMSIRAHSSTAARPGRSVPVTAE